MMRLESEHEALVELAHTLHEEARLHSKAHSFVVGSVMRGCANRILWELGEPRIPYEGPPPPVPVLHHHHGDLGLCSCSEVPS